jgi:hypothetical protein
MLYVVGVAVCDLILILPLSLCLYISLSFCVSPSLSHSLSLSPPRSLPPTPSPTPPHPTPPHPSLSHTHPQVSLLSKLIMKFWAVLVLLTFVSLLVKGKWQNVLVRYEIYLCIYYTVAK